MTIDVQVKNDYEGYFEAYTLEALKDLKPKNIKKIVVSAGPWRPYAVSCTIKGEDIKHSAIKKWKKSWIKRDRAEGKIDKTQEEEKLREIEKEHELDFDVCEVDYYSATRSGFGDLTLEMTRDCIEQCDIQSARLREEFDQWKKEQK